MYFSAYHRILHLVLQIKCLRLVSSLESGGQGGGYGNICHFGLQSDPNTPLTNDGRNLRNLAGLHRFCGWHTMEIAVVHREPWGRRCSRHMVPVVPHFHYGIQHEIGRYGAHAINRIVVERCKGPWSTVDLLEETLVCLLVSSWRDHGHTRSPAIYCNQETLEGHILK